MQPDLLQQLKDIHVPTDPAWWPPAPGWWLLAVVAVLGVLFAIRHAYLYHRRRRPIRHARRLYKALYERLDAGELPAQLYVHESNELLKRLLIHGLGRREARPAANSAWLQLLDECYGSPAFSEGPGQILGNERFRPTPTIDTESLHGLLASFLGKVRP
ncbi:MAG: DUF4381 domain-containing protein [Gammaproteobacteria bacterium]|nr:DUF4381 domain-containing protein [Gammaproteobacteria bacterium]